MDNEEAITEVLDKVARIKLQGRAARLPKTLYPREWENPVDGLRGEG